MLSVSTVYCGICMLSICSLHVNCIVGAPDIQGPIHITNICVKGATLCVLENEALTSLNSKASDRVQLAFRPKTRKAYSTMFRTFAAFCIITKSCIVNVNLKLVLSFLECLVLNSCSCCMIANYVSALKANFVLYDLPFHVLDHPKVKYFVKTLKINRPLSINSYNVITIPILIKISESCEALDSGLVYRTAILLGFFAFMRLSNLAPHALALFDESRHLTGEDILFTKDYAKIIIKWSKTIQTRDRIQCVTLPKLRNKIICPYRALKALFRSYPMSPHTSLLQISSKRGLNPLTDSRVRKVFKHINVSLGYRPGYFTFHDLRRSGATYAFNSHVPIQDIKRHGTWSSDCVWRYIQSDHASGERLANALAMSINAL